MQLYQKCFTFYLYLAFSILNLIEGELPIIGNLPYGSTVTDADFEYGYPSGKIVIYRLIGNDMPPLQQRGQLRWNTKYALDNEPHFHGVTKRWILNRIWNDTDYTAIYADLLGAGVNRRDIISNCFDLNKYQSFKTTEDKLFYLTAQNEGRNLGIIDGRKSGFEWSVVLDGNTFISRDSWMAIEKALQVATDKKLTYMKIPYHRVHEEQTLRWLNSSTSMKTLLKFAPIKGESQVAFHRLATEMFTLGDTKPDQKDPKKRKGYGQRNKSYMFKEGGLCALDSKSCQCAAVQEGNEEDLKKSGKPDIKYAKDCGVVLRLWTYPTDEVLTTGLTPAEEEGFFCYLEEYSNHNPNPCRRIIEAAAEWRKIKKSDKNRHTGTKAAACKAKFQNLFLTESCVRAADREIATARVAESLSSMANNKYKSSQSLCFRATKDSTKSTTSHFLTVFDDVTLTLESAAWRDKSSSLHNAIAPLVSNLIEKAERGMTLGPYSVMDKKRTMVDVTDKRFYYSVRPYYWPIDLVSKDIVEAAKLAAALKKRKSEVTDKYVHRDGVRVPGSIIAGEGAELTDRSSAWYFVDNVTTLALAWQFTQDKKYATYAVKLLDVYILDEKTGMYPNLNCSQDSTRLGLIDWKDTYFLLDAVTLLQKSGAMTQQQVLKMQSWCADLALWFMASTQGLEEGNSNNNHGMYFDLSTLALSKYGKNVEIMDFARSRLKFRLSHTYPDGHFALDGNQPHETVRPTSLHYITFNLIGWFHNALIVDSLRKNHVLPDSFPSLWWMRHKNETAADRPVLLKATHWYIQFLPSDPAAYEHWTEPVEGMGINFPFKQEDHFAFDRMLEIVHYSVRIYGLHNVFTDKQLSSKAVQAVLNFPFYSPKKAMMSKYSSADPDSGGRVWPSLGVLNHYSAGPDSALWYNEDRKYRK